MKKTILFLMSFLLLTAITAQDNKVKTYKIKSGYVKYKPLDKGVVGIHEIWWDNYGKSVREVYNITTTTKFFGKKSVSKNHSVVITKGKHIWTADLEKNTGFQAVNPMYDFVQDNMGQMSDSEQEQTVNSILGSFGGKKVGKEEFMGYTCEVTKMWGSKVWMYKGVVLKSEGKMLGVKTGEVATEFKPNSSVSASKFEPLSDIEYEKVQGLEESFGEMDDTEGDEEFVPLNYPFAKFKSKMENYKPQGYVKMGPMSIQKSMYTCVWMQGQNDMLAVSAMSKQNKEEFDLKQFLKVRGVQKIRHNGHDCYYATPKELELYKQTSQENIEHEGEDEMPTLIVVYEKYDMVITLTGKPDKTKEKLLKILDVFDF